MIGKRGGAADLDFLLDQALSTRRRSRPPNRLKALEALAEAALTRETSGPTGDLGRLAPLIAPTADPGVAAGGDPARRALEGRGARRPASRAIAGAADTPEPAPRLGASTPSAAIGGEQGRASIEALDRAGPAARRSAPWPSPRSRGSTSTPPPRQAAELSSRTPRRAAGRLAPLDRRLPQPPGRRRRPRRRDRHGEASRPTPPSSPSGPSTPWAAPTPRSSPPLTKAAGIDAEVKPLDQGRDGHASSPTSPPRATPPGASRSSAGPT